MAKIRPKFLVDRMEAVERLERIRLAQGDQGMSRGDFAGTLGMYPSNYTRLTNGEFFLTADQLYTLWRLYGADPAFIMEGREDGLPDRLRQKLRGLTATP